VDAALHHVHDDLDPGRPGPGGQPLGITANEIDLAHLEEQWGKSFQWATGRRGPGRAGIAAGTDVVAGAGPQESLGDERVPDRRTRWSVPFGVEVHPARQRHHPARRRKAGLYRPRRHGQGQTTPAGVSEADQAVRVLSCLHQTPVDSAAVIERGRATVFGGQAVVDGDDIQTEPVGHELGVEEVGLEIAGHEGAAVAEEDQTAVRIAGRPGQATGAHSPHRFRHHRGVRGHRVAVPRSHLVPGGRGIVVGVGEVSGHGRHDLAEQLAGHGREPSARSRGGRFGPTQEWTRSRYTTTGESACAAQC
jgi:hypothetical protein